MPIREIETQIDETLPRNARRAMALLDQSISSGHPQEQAARTAAHVLQLILENDPSAHRGAKTLERMLRDAVNHSAAETSADDHIHALRDRASFWTLCDLNGMVLAVDFEDVDPAIRCPECAARRSVLAQLSPPCLGS